ncbi:MAG: HAMP domain-containing sensor histidine kinase, partial [Rhodospirillaceae bacterium]
IKITAKVRGGDVELEVQDSGVGFPAEQSDRLFDKFFRGESRGGRDSTGTGLGLFIVDRFMYFEGGNVRAHSDGPGQGATFTLTWHSAAKRAS